MRQNNLESSIVSASDTWKDKIIDINVCRKDSAICWQNFSEPIEHFNPSTFIELMDLIDNKKYSVRFIDSSIMILYYRFDKTGTTLEEAELGFYRCETKEECVARIGDENIPDDQIDDLRKVYWIRIDYRPEHAKEPYHSACHMHIQDFFDTRIGLNRVPTPKQFFEFIMASFYPEEYIKIRYKENSFDHSCIPVVNADSHGLVNNLYLLHLSIP